MQSPCGRALLFHFGLDEIIGLANALILRVCLLVKAEVVFRLFFHHGISMPHGVSLRLIVIIIVAIFARIKGVIDMTSTCIACFCVILALHSCVPTVLVDAVRLTVFYLGTILLVVRGMA